MVQIETAHHLARTKDLPACNLSTCHYFKLRYRLSADRCSLSFVPEAQFQSLVCGPSISRIVTRSARYLCDRSIHYRDADLCSQMTMLHVVRGIIQSLQFQV